jgi:hypothetical protein
MFAWKAFHLRSLLNMNSDTELNITIFNKRLKIECPKGSIEERFDDIDILLERLQSFIATSTEKETLDISLQNTFYRIKVNT